MTAAPRTRMPSERLTLAFRRGDAARDQHRIRPAAHMLYEHLVRFAGECDWCWPSEERLANQMRCSISTIKRMLRELIQAGLIARARRLNRSSLTYITAYMLQEACAIDIDMTAQELTSAPEPTTSAVAMVSADPEDMNVPDRSTLVEPTFFGTTPDPSVGPDMNQEIDLKNQNPEGLVDGRSASPDHVPPAMQGSPNSPVIVTLRDAGVVDRGVLEELAAQPLAQVEQAIRSVNQVRSLDDPRRPGLLVHILRTTGHPLSEIGDMMPPCEKSYQAARTSREERPSEGVYHCPDNGDETVAIWDAAMTCVAREVPSTEFRTWLEPTKLLELGEDIAIVATPNVFVRDEVMNRYARHVSHALSTQVGHAIEVVMVIG